MRIIPQFVKPMFTKALKYIRPQNKTELPAKLAARPLVADHISRADSGRAAHNANRPTTTPRSTNAGQLYPAKTQRNWDSYSELHKAYSGESMLDSHGVPEYLHGESKLRSNIRQTGSQIEDRIRELKARSLPKVSVDRKNSIPVRSPGTLPSQRSRDIERLVEKHRPGYVGGQNTNITRAEVQEFYSMNDLHNTVMNPRKEALRQSDSSLTYASNRDMNSHIRKQDRQQELDAHQEALNNGY